MIEPRLARAWAMPSPWTFTIPPIRDLVIRYVAGGDGWADPYCGKSKLAEYRNDLNPESPAAYHMDALEFAKGLPESLEGVLFDPPYSYRQVTECYKSVGIRARAIDTSANFYARVIEAVAPKIKHGGHAIRCGWNSAGFGQNRGFELIEQLNVCHGSAHNDTIVTVERKA